MKYFKYYIEENIKWILAILLNGTIMVIIMLLNDISFSEMAYGVFVCILFLLCVISVGFYRSYIHCKKLEELEKVITISTNKMPLPKYQYEVKYQECIQILEREKAKIQNEMFSMQQELSEYYSMWVHQIKTPISALKLLIGEETNIIDEKDFASEASVKTIAATKKKQQELFKIEQYVDMALQYMRLDFTANDFVIREICLDDVVRNAVHKYARQFVYNNLYLKYEQTQINAITDEKWLGFVIEQILSNAIKYTKSGGITIKLYEKIYNKKIGADAIKDSDAIWIEKEETLPYKETIISIEDTGIGISAEDLPRVCEMGYTGGNGHGCTVGVDGKHSTGIGLYLCKRILDKLGHKLNISSVQGKGTRVEIIIHLIRS